MFSLLDVHSRRRPQNSERRNAIYGMGTMKILLQSIRSKEGPHYRLGAKREEAVRRQATINLYSRVQISFGDYTWAILRSLDNARKCQLEDFCEKERLNHIQSNRRSQQTPSAKFGKEKTLPVVMLLLGSHERLASRNPRVLFQTHGGACTMYQR